MHGRGWGLQGFIININKLQTNVFIQMLHFVLLLRLFVLIMVIGAAKYLK